MIDYDNPMGGFHSMRGYYFLVKEQVIEQDMFYKDHNVLHYTIKYPLFISDTYHMLAQKLNTLYKTKAVMFERSDIMNLYQMAMVEYEYSVANDFPIRPFEVYVNYEVTYNQNCALSLYFDQYEYTGGAHGLTYRYSDTWNLAKSKKEELTDFFPNTTDVMEFVINNIIEQIELENKKGDSIYFEDYPQRVRESIKKNNFYLSKDGLVIYFQQYDIAPYSSGIPNFLIPYSPLGAEEPTCPYYI